MKIVHISDSHISHQFPERAKDLEACIHLINALDPAPTVVVHTGDISHDGLAEEYSTAQSLLNRLHRPYLVMGGNRDKRDALIQQFADGQHIRTGDLFIQYAVDQYAVRLIVIDTMSEDSNKGRICEARMEHLKSMLNENSSKPTAIFMHHTPFRVDAIPDPHQFEHWEDVDKLGELLDLHTQIVGIYCVLHHSYHPCASRRPCRKWLSQYGDPMYR